MVKKYFSAFISVLHRAYLCEELCQYMRCDCRVERCCGGEAESRSDLGCQDLSTMAESGAHHTQNTLRGQSVTLFLLCADAADV